MRHAILLTALLFLACLGVGGLALQAWRHRLPRFPVWAMAALAYVLGQGILAAGLLLLALAGLFHPWLILTLLAAGAAAALRSAWQSRGDWRTSVGQAALAFRRTPFGWQVLAVLATGLYLCGFATIGAAPAGDAVAVYLAIAKTTAYAHQLFPLAGYNEFTVSIGLYAEMLVAALIGLGVPLDLARSYSWVNYLPTLILLWALARAVGLGGRGALLSLCVALTSSAALLFWGGGKTDLYAVAPALAALVVAFAAWEPPRRRGATLLAGLFCGLALVFKISLLVVLLPSVLLVLYWPDLFRLAGALRRRSGLRIWAITRRGVPELGVFGLGLVLTILPHLAKNLWLGGSVFGLGDASTAFYTAATLRRLVLTYPLALTYGRYWAQYGNLSPLVIAFLPLLAFLPRPASWCRSRLTALTLSTLIGLGFWISLMPAVFMPRYFLSSLLVLGIPAAAGAAWFSRQGKVAGLTVLLATAVTILYTPAHVNSWEPAFDWPATQRRLAHPKEECLNAAHMGNYCAALAAINAVVATPPHGRDRVLLFSWYRLWLRPDLLLTTNTYNESKEIERAADSWGLVRRKGFGFVLLDPGYPQTKRLTERLAEAGNLRELYRDGTLTAYEILP